jgi:DNA-binding GntR family transcriptional regulator
MIVQQSCHNNVFIFHEIQDAILQIQRGVIIIARVTQTTMVYNELKDRILKGNYHPAESLPEIELATEFNVSRNTVKKALLMLESDALVTIETNKGAKVRSYSKQEILDFMELRAELEGFITRLAVPYITEEDIEMGESILAEMLTCKTNGDLMGYSSRNPLFHQIIYSRCPNRKAVEVMTALKSRMKKYNGKTILIPGRSEISYNEHAAILDALRKRNALLAEERVRAHILSVRSVFDEYYQLLF